MFEFEKILGNGYATQEEAIAPLLAERENLANFRGFTSFPKYDLTYSYVAGRQRDELQVQIRIQLDIRGYSISAQIDPVSGGNKLMLICANAALGILVTVSYLKGHGSFLAAIISFLAVALLVSGIICFPGFLGARKAIGELKKVYRLH